MGERLTNIGLERALDIIGDVVGEPLYVVNVGDAGKPAIFRANIAGRSLFVRIIKTSYTAEIYAENKLVLFASKTGVDCIGCSFLSSHQSGYTAVWRPWVDGVVENTISEECAYKIGEGLGKLHMADRTGFSPRMFQYYNFCNVRHKKWALFLNILDDAAPAETRPLRRFLSNAMNCISQVHSCYDSLFDCGEIVHGDVHGGNIVRDVNKVTFLDWESSGVGAAIVDLSVANYHFCFGDDSIGCVLDNSLTKGYFRHGKVFMDDELIAGLIVSGLSYYIHDLMGLVRVMRGDLDRHLTARAENHFSIRIPEFRRFLDWCYRTKSLVGLDFGVDEVEMALLNLAKDLGFFEVLRTAKARSKVRVRG